MDDIARHGQVRVNDDGTVTLPADALSAADLTAGDSVMVSTTDGQIVLTPWTEDRIRELLD